VEKPGNRHTPTPGKPDTPLKITSES